MIGARAAELWRLIATLCNRLSSRDSAHSRYAWRATGQRWSPAACRLRSYGTVLRSQVALAAWSGSVLAARETGKAFAGEAAWAGDGLISGLVDQRAAH